MTEAALKLVIGAVDNASGVVEKLEKKTTTSFEKMSSIVKGLGKTMTVVGGVITGALGLCVKAAMDEERAMVSTATSLKAYAKQAGLSEEETKKLGAMVQEVAGDFQEWTGFSDELAGKSFARLIGATKDTAKAQELLGVAADFARYKNIDLESATTTLMQVMAGNTRVLKEFGIEMTASSLKEEAATLIKDKKIEKVKELINTLGNEEEKQAAMNLLNEKNNDGLLELLETIDSRIDKEGAMQVVMDKSAGASEEWSDSLEGSIGKVKNQIGDLQKKIGRELIPILQELVDKILPIIQNIMGWIKENPELFKQIVLITGAVGGLMVVLGPLLIMLPGLVTAIGLLISPITLVIVAIGLLITVGILFINRWENIKGNFIAIWDDLKFRLSERIENIRLNITAFIDRTVADFKDLPNRIWEAIKNVGSTIIRAFQGIKIPMPHFSLGTQYQDFLGASIPMPKFNVNWYKEGGKFTKPSIIGIAENGPEAVVPLDKEFGNVTVNINGGYFMDGVERFGDELFDILKRRLKYVNLG